MAIAPLQPCPYPHCRRLVRAGRCSKHQVPGAPAWRSAHGPPPARLRGRGLQRARAALFAAHPLCVSCLAQGRHTPATIRDHVIPLAEGGRDDAGNEQALCHDCSNAKTRSESARGGRRHRLS
jgi:5-methylcytosine-specific restriction protein A